MTKQPNLQLCPTCMKRFDGDMCVRCEREEKVRVWKVTPFGDKRSCFLHESDHEALTSWIEGMSVGYGLSVGSVVVKKTKRKDGYTFDEVITDEAIDKLQKRIKKYDTFTEYGV